MPRSVTSEPPQELTLRNDVTSSTTVVTDTEGSSENTPREARPSSPPAVMPQLPTNWPERLKLQHVLGAGGTSTVVAATDLDLDRDVAIKLLHEHGAHDATTVSRFLHEARLTAGLEHPNIVPIYRVERRGDVPYLEMRQVRGEALGRLTRRARRLGRSEVVPVNDLINIFLKVCDALAYAHDRGILHRDIKPDNIMVGEFGEVMLVDWGTAQAASESEEGVIVGTPQYMSPERARGVAATASDDVYSLGATLFSALLLRRPLAELSGETFWAKKVSGEIIEPTAEERARVPKSLLDIALRAMRPEVGERYPSAIAFADALRNYQAGNAAWVPLSSETFDTDWRSRWATIEGAAFAVENARFVSQSLRDSWIFFQRRLAAGVAIEFEGEIPEGTLPGDLSVAWVQRDDFDGSAPVISAGAMDQESFRLQVGAYANACSCITRGHETVEWSPFRLEIGRRHAIRAEVDERALRMFVDGVLICEHEAVFPLRSGYLGFYAYYPGKSFGNVRIYTRGIADRVSPILIGDEFYRWNHVEQAIEQYRRVADAHAGEPIAEEATYKQGLCLQRLGREVDARRVWTSIRHQTYRNYVALHSLDQSLAASNYGEWFARFRELYSAAPPFRTQLRNRWLHAVHSLHQLQADFTQFLELRRELFADDPMTAAAEAAALDRMGEWEKILERHGQLLLPCVMALFALGRTREALELGRDVSFLRNEALLRLGRGSEIPPGEDLYGARLLLEGKLDEAATLDRNAETLLIARRPEDALACNDGLYNGTALRRLGRIEEAVAIGDPASLLYQGLFERALARANDPEALYLIWSYGAVAAWADGDCERYRKACSELQRVPFSWRWGNAWPSKCFLLPFLQGLDERSDAFARACRWAADSTEYVHIQRPWYIARLILREIDEAEFDRQPSKIFREAGKAIALALRAELGNEPAVAVEHYRAYQALPADQRALDQRNNDPVLDRFVTWRCEVLTRTSRSG